MILFALFVFFEHKSIARLFVFNSYFIYSHSYPFTYHSLYSIRPQFMYASRPDLVLVLLCFGFLFGVILASFGFYCCIDRNASQVVQKYVRPFENQKKTQEEKQEQARVVQEEDKQQQPAFSQEKTANDFMKSSSPAVDNSEDFKDKMMKKAAKQD